MTTTRNSFLYNVMMYAILMGGMLVSVDLLGYLLGAYNGFLSQSLSLVIYIYCLYFFCVKYREEHQGGFITYWQGVFFITGLSFFASMILGLFTYILMKYIDPDLFHQLMEEIESNYVMIFDQNEGVLSNQMQETLIENVRKIRPMDLWSSKMSSYLIGGFFVALIMSFFTRRINTDPFHEIN